MQDEQQQAQVAEVVSGVEAEGGDPNPWMIGVVSIVACVAIVAIILALMAMFARASQQEWQAKVVNVAPQELYDLLDKQQSALHTAHWIDRQQGIVAIPIERAMELTVQELQRTGGQPAAPAASPQPQASAAGSGAAEQPGHNSSPATENRSETHSKTGAKNPAEHTKAGVH